MSQYEWEQADKHNPWGKKRVRGSHCSKGHEFTEDNTFIRAYDNARVCRECRKQYAREKYQRNKTKNGTGRVKKDKVVAFELPESARVRDEAAGLWRQFQDELRDIETPCKVAGPEFFADNTHWITDDEAEEMCHGCPLLKLCYDYATAQGEVAGIWGGIRFGDREEALFELE